ncbi:WD40-repeat-containing domain protein [Halteromyces radiatus]|uniref:WD40-repeat-containing domain protein n=1 Tax=Halteromyces radiatus TaxID=101107 RepID=UPI0022201502|nr:WD40-repeat-containing domain protein [Halteromyces radiatus]KAI8092506.1 WD40-repeat-containing domain protein [Halteromyces radiatus]
MLSYLFQKNPTKSSKGFTSPSTSNTSSKTTINHSSPTRKKSDSSSHKRQQSKQYPPSDPRATLKRSLSAHSGLDAVSQDWLNAPRPIKTVKRMESFDRFIPHRQSMDMSSSQFNLANKNESTDLDHDTDDYNNSVAHALGYARDKRILSFVPNPPEYKKSEDIRRNPLSLYTVGGRIQHSSSSFSPAYHLQQRNTIPMRRIVTAPEKILDAPYMKDDYYLNLLDWSCQNVVAIGLDRSIYLWNADNGTIQPLNYNGDETITSLSWSADGSYLALGTGSGDTQIWDVEANSKLRSMTGRQCRVGVLSWEKYIVSSGAKDGSIWNHDVRVAKHKTAELLKHEDEVCGLKWSPDGTNLASGGNDNFVCVWDARSTNPKFCKDVHRGAIKALAWCPWNHHVLATGGGREDKKIHFWNTKTTARINSVKTESQVTSLHWSKHYKEIVSTHGYPNNQLSVWSFPKLQKLIDIPGHDSRILHSALSPDGQVLATAAADENLKFWRIFENDGSRSLILPKGQSDKSDWIRRTTSLR